MPRAARFPRHGLRYLLDLRLDYAERLLVQENMTIADVAYLSGFSSQSHLTSAMKSTNKLRQRWYAVPSAEPHVIA
jgi:AraC family transcriptional regulator